MHTTHYERGFTLIEILLYLALVMIMLGVLGAIGIDVLGSRAKAKAQQELNYTAVFIHEKLRTAIADSSAIRVPQEGESGSVLELSMHTAEKDPTIFSVMDGVLYIQEGEFEPEALSGATALIPDPVFTNVADTSVQSLISLQARNPHMQSTYAASSTFQSTTRLRF